jgi:hypothetical protein
MRRRERAGSPESKQNIKYGHAIVESNRVGAEAMIRNRSVCAVVSLVAVTCVTTPSRANGLVVENDTDIANRSAYLNWMAQTQVNGLAAPIAIANQPCYVYEGPHLVVLPCPGTVNYVRARY